MSEIITKVDGCTITARVEATGVAVQIVSDEIEGPVKLAEVLVESFGGVRQIHVYPGDEDQPTQSIEL